MAGRDDLGGLIEALFRPHRPRLAEARALVGGLPTGRQAWRMLSDRGLVPPEKTTDKVGVPYREAGWGRGDPPWSPTEETEDDIDAWVCLAADPEGVSRASTVARRLVDAISQAAAETKLEESSVADIRWCALSVGWDPLRGLGATDPRAVALDTARRSIEAIVGRVSENTHSYRAVVRAARPGVASARLLARDLGTLELFETAHSKRVSALFDKSLFDHLVSIWSCGYALARVDSRSALLVAPRV